jgi:hypothetical protein
VHGLEKWVRNFGDFSRLNGACGETRAWDKWKHREIGKKYIALDKVKRETV